MYGTAYAVCSSACSSSPSDLHITGLGSPSPASVVAPKAAKVVSSVCWGDLEDSPAVVVPPPVPLLPTSGMGLQEQLHAAHLHIADLEAKQRIADLVDHLKQKQIDNLNSQVQAMIEAAAGSLKERQALLQEDMASHKRPRVRQKLTLAFNRRSERSADSCRCCLCR